MIYDDFETITYNCEQGSDEWFHVKMGLLSASKISCLFVRPKDGSQWGKGALTYFDKLSTEYVTRQRVSISTKALAWGNYYEDEARKRYEEVTGYKVDQVGFIQFGELTGTSPDGLVGSDGVIEIKCPTKLEIFYKYVADTRAHRIPKQHIPQCFHNVFGTQRKWCDFIAYQPELTGSNQIKIVRASIEEMKTFSTPDVFNSRLLEAEITLKQMITKKLKIKEIAERKVNKFSNCNF